MLCFGRAFCFLHIFVVYLSKKMEETTKHEPTYWELLYYNYAGRAMQQLINNNIKQPNKSILPVNSVEYNAQKIAKEACIYAKALIIELKKEQKICEN